MMGPIGIGKAIADYGVPMITAILLLLFCWLIKHLINEQAKTNKGILSMFQVELKALHKDGKTNARLNRKSIRITSALAEYLNKYFNGCADKVNLKKKVKTNEQK